MADVGPEEKEARREEQAELRTQEDPAPVVPVDQWAEPECDEHHRHELDDADHADRGRRLGDRVHLHEQRDDRDLRAEL